ncbi:uncharacterized protein LOC131842935 [Achroia grisella]|uniref:uncharacterized protein LOC131842935 n=1 Tax=Achroia grisella TaxID=688607 RepID=UPI0027D229A5|nr:uncharacterized protein LOC131842935 [Achroia grisella]
MARAARIALDLALASSKALRPTLGYIWQYAKTEVVPPMTLNFFHGSGGKSLENTISKFANGFIAGIERKIKETDAEQLRVIKGREAAIKAQQDKTKAAAKRKEEKRKRQEKQKKKELEIAAQVKAREENKTKPEKETPKKNDKRS